MADVTDVAFRSLVARYGKPDVLWSEFVSADGLFHTREIQKMPDSENPLMKDLLYGEEERPIVAQLFSATPEMMAYGATLARELGFDGVDINMGCPDKNIIKQGAGAGCIKNPKNARALIRAAKEGGLPVSVKTRLGFNTDTLDEWLPEILEESPALVTIHARTKKEMSDVPAKWERVARAVEIRDEMKSDALIFGNGDIVDIPDALEKACASGADGAMLGRAIFGNPWLFRNLSELKEGRLEVYTPTLEERLRVMCEHTKLFTEQLTHKNFSILKKNYKAYANGFSGAKELRMQLMEAGGYEEVVRITEEFLRQK